MQQTETELELTDSLGVLDATGGLGLVGIRERLAPLQGSMRCENVNGGARLAAIIPLETTYAATRAGG